MKQMPKLDSYFSNLNPSLTRLTKLMVLFVFGLHVAACGVGFLVQQEHNSLLLLLKDEDDPDDFIVAWGGWSAGMQYSRVLVWCVCALMGDVGTFGAPTTPRQVGYCVVFIICGLLWISIVTGSAASLLANMDSAKQDQKDKIDGIKMYLRFKKVPGAVTESVLEYFEYLSDSGRHFEETGNGGLPVVFDSLPDRLHM
jgi:hypothetical protein